MGIRTTFASLALVTAGMLSGCGDSTPTTTPPDDTGVAEDLGTPPTDLGNPTPDTGNPTPDTGNPTPDTGNPDPDAGPVDTGNPVLDTGNPDPDAGPVDTGNPVLDTGNPDPDVGTPTPDTGPSCGAGETRCGDACVNLATSNTHCGSCNAACGSNQQCAQAICRIQCGGGQTECAGACVSTQTDRNHCGACGTACPAGQLCSAGSCVVECSSGVTACNNTCRDLQTDPAHCGACGNACATGLVCANGTCQCPTGSITCNGACVNPQTDRNHCGACGMTCDAGQICGAGRCTAARACDDLLARAPGTPSGAYIIDPDGAGGRDAFRVYCDMRTDGGGWTLVAASAGETNMPRFDNATITPCTSATPTAPCYVGAANFAALGLTEFAWSTENVAVNTRAPLENHREGPAPTTNATCVSSSEYFRFNQDSAEQGMGWTGCEVTEVYNAVATCNSMFRPAWNLQTCDNVPISPGARTSPDYNCSPFGRYNSACTEFRNMRHWRRSTTCAGRALNCGGYCRQIGYDVNNCGTCGNVCGAGQACVSGVCSTVRSCRELLMRQPGIPSGTYPIDPDGDGGAAGFRVYCDMETAGGGWTLVSAAVLETNMPRFTNNAVTPCVASTPNAPCFMGRAALTALPFTEFAWSTGPTAVNTRAPIDAHVQGAATVNAICVNQEEYFRLNQDSAEQGMGWTGCTPTEVYNATATCNSMFRPAWNLLTCEGIPISPGARTSPDFNCSPFGRYNSACNDFRNMRYWRR